MTIENMRIMHNIDRLYRPVSFSRRRVLIILRILVVLSGSFLVINYAVLSENPAISKQRILRPSFLRIIDKSNNTALRNDTKKEQSLESSSSISTVSHISQFGVSFISSTTTPPILLPVINFTEPEIIQDDTDYFLQEDFLNDDLEINSTEFINNFFIFPCKNMSTRRIQKRKKNLVVYENFILAKRAMKCYESITYTTHGDWRYLDNLIPLAERWNGPISVAVYSPGDDLQETLRIISYLRTCMTNKISELVSFHLVFETKYNRNKGPKEMQFRWIDGLYEKERWTDCSRQPNLQKDQPTFRVRKRLLYPVNIARNIARSAATTHFVLASDIELYPSVNLIPAFFRMLKEQTTNDLLSPASPRVFVLPIFEVKKGLNPPRNKTSLVAMLKSSQAVPFHNFVCRECHIIPKYAEWTKIPNHSGLHVFHVAKRKPPLQFWEPIYIGTKYEPLYDERLSYEGLRDKMTQGYILCALDYDFMVLDSAFLIHRPGIKRLAHKVTKTVLRQDRLINLKIKAELFRRFGKQEGCVL